MASPGFSVDQLMELAGDAFFSAPLRWVVFKHQIKKGRVDGWSDCFKHIMIFVNFSFLFCFLEDIKPEKTVEL